MAMIIHKYTSKTSQWVIESRIFVIIFLRLKHPLRSETDFYIFFLKKKMKTKFIVMKIKKLC